jgi:hypothetical protein
LYVEIVKTIAEIAGGLAGFVGIVFILGRRSERKLTIYERNGLFHLLIGSVGTLLLSIVLMILVASIENIDTAWRIGAGLMATYGFFGSTNAIREELRGEHNLPAPFNWILPITAQLLSVFGVLAAVGYLDGLAALACVLLLLMGFIVAITYFIVLLTGHKESTEANEQHEI